MHTDMEHGMRRDWINVSRGKGALLFMHPLSTSNLMPTSRTTDVSYSMATTIILLYATCQSSPSNSRFCTLWVCSPTHQEPPDFIPSPLCNARPNDLETLQIDVSPSLIEPLIVLLLMYLL